MSTPLTSRITTELAEFLLRDLALSDGVFAASLDAESAGVEGGSYRWDATQWQTAVGDDDFVAAAEAFGIDPGFPDGAPQVLQRPHDSADTDWFNRIHDRLRAARARRTQPGRDDIVVLGANALAITALAEAGVALDRTLWVDAADRACETLLRLHRTRAGWLHSSLHGHADAFPATLSDHAAMITALTTLYQATGHSGRLKLAIKTSHEMLAQFQADDGRWFDTPGQRDSTDGPVINRPRDITDTVVPAGMSAAAEALLTIAALTGITDFRRSAEYALAQAGALITRFPRAAGWYAAVSEAMVAGPLQIAIVGAAGAPRAELLAVARQHAPAGSVIDYGVPDEQDRPLLAGRSR